MEDISFWGDYDGGGDSADPVVRNSYALCLQTGGLPLFPDQSAEGNLNNGQLPNDSEGSGSGNGCGDVICVIRLQDMANFQAWILCVSWDYTCVAQLYCTMNSIG